MKLVSLTNPNSRSAASTLSALRAAIPETPSIEHRVTKTLAELDAVVNQQQWSPEHTLVINGGDGSVQRILTLLYATCDTQQWPTIALLPAGHTNMSASDVNAHRTCKQCLNTLNSTRKGARAQSIKRQSLVTVQNPTHAQLGFFFGIGTIVNGVEFFNSQLREKAGRQESGAALAMLRTLWGILRKQPPFSEALNVKLSHVSDQNGPLPAPCRIADTEDFVPLRLCLISTLEKLFLQMKPYWGMTDAALHTTLVEARAPRFLTNLPRLMRGKPGPAMTCEQGYHSNNFAALTLNFSGVYTLDGELFDNIGPLAIKATPPIRFIRL